MTYFTSLSAAKNGVGLGPLTKACFACGQPVEGPVVVYDGSDGAVSKRFIFHRKCALEVANRLIIDAWPHRHIHPRVTLDE